MVRLVKGAYWDSEIKRAQIEGLDGYPVYTRKAYTDVSYLACARRLLAAPAEIYPQFATHNAHTMAAIYTIAGPASYQPGQYEFQCLHGMGEPLYEQVVGDTSQGKLGRPCRIYAPVGTHETLLAYLVRRLLENGANTSFVNRIADTSISLASLVEDPVKTVERFALDEGAVGLQHPLIPTPAGLYGAARLNSMGLDLANEDVLRQLRKSLEDSAAIEWRAEPIVFAECSRAPSQDHWADLLNPADNRDVVGRVREATSDEVDSALEAAQASSSAWAHTPPELRASKLEAAADLLEGRMQVLMGLLAREAGKTYPNAIAEVREAVDFLRFYAAQARSDFSNETHRPLGPMVCISPWNFPLAIFLGQVAAALAAGNTVLAKPAEQTPLVAAEAVRILLQADIPPGVVQLLPGRGESVGARLVADPRVQGVMFTGSTEVARILQKTVAKRLGADGKPVPLIAETGGQNAMIVDSSALVEQVVADVMASAFDSAGQRCSALRVLCLQEEAADRVIEMLKGAMLEANVGNPARLAVDIGPVIDAEARDGIEQHIAMMRNRGRRVYRQGRVDDGATRHGTFVMPTLIELDSLTELRREVFGPVLHVVRYRRRDLDALIGEINATGYGLTLGVHTRIDETVSQVVDQCRAGNVYVNRNIVGAVVGVQPFGGEGLSGTGPKAGGPLYMYRMLSRRPDDVMRRAMADAEHRNAPGLISSLAMAQYGDQTAFAKAIDTFSELSRAGYTKTLTGPTGERNVYSLVPRDAVLCLAGSDSDRLVQLAAVMAVGSVAVWPAEPGPQRLYETLPDDLRRSIVLALDWTAPTVSFDVVLHHGDETGLTEVVEKVAGRQGAIVGVRGFRAGDTDIPLEALVVERALSVNTAAAGGNASLMTIG